MSTTLELPLAAQTRIKAMQDDMRALQTSMQMFVDGVLAGMGQDMTKKIKVDLDLMTATIMEDEA